MSNHTHHAAMHAHDCHAAASHPQEHDKHAGHSVAMFRDRFWLSLLFTIPIVLYAPMVQEWLGFSMPSFPGYRWLAPILGTIVFWYGGLVFLKSAAGELRARLPGMMTLISVAIVAAYVYSIATTFFIPGTEFFWELATLIVIMLLGHWMEMRSVSNAQGALKELAKLLPDIAVLADGREVALSELRVGDIVVVRPGGKVPADGSMVEGRTQVNESMITGESRPVSKQTGDMVIAGTINGSGSIRMQVRKVGESTLLAGIMRLVHEVQSSKSRAQILADRAAFYFTIVAVAAGFATLVGWLLAGRSVNFALDRMVTVLVIACPHALGLAVPLVTSISTTLGARSGVLVKQRMALESARHINVVLFDKTGTLTKGEQAVIDVWPALAVTERELLSLAAAVEQGSEHSIGKAVIAKAQGFAVTPALQVMALPGQGVQGEVQGRVISVGGPRLLEAQQVAIPPLLAAEVQQANADGKTVIYVVEHHTVLGALTVADEIRDESRGAVRQLKAMGIKVAMITGDSEGVASYVAQKLGLDEYFAEVLPAHKADKVKFLQHGGKRVAMVGDGINDAPALTQADVGIAIGAGTDVAIESAGIVLVKNNPLDIPRIIKLSRATYRKMVQNLFWATGYNVVAIPLAAGVLAAWGIILAPAVGAVLMSLSTVVVALNAQLLRRMKL